MKTYDLILKRRTVRKFKQKKIKRNILLDCVNSGRLAPSSANLQPLEYILVIKNLKKVFECTNWAGYLKNAAPGKNERPVAYIIIISNTKINKDARYDAGLAAENIILTALERGIASCIIGSLDREKLKTNLFIPEDYAVELVVALGYSGQISIVDNFGGDVKYWLEKNVLHVPKRSIITIFHEDHF